MANTTSATHGTEVEVMSSDILNQVLEMINTPNPIGYAFNQSDVDKLRERAKKVDDKAFLKANLMFGCNVYLDPSIPDGFYHVRMSDGSIITKEWNND